MILHLVDAGDDTVHDTITLDGDGQLVFETGAARDMVEAFREHRLPPGRRGDADVHARLAEAGWSNGYIAIRRAAP